MNKESGNNFLRFLSIVFKNKPLNFLAFILVISTSVLSICIPNITKDIIDISIKQRDTKILAKLIILFVVFSTLSVLGEFLLSYIYSRIGKKVVIDLKLKLLKHLIKLSGKYYTEMKTGEILTTFERDVFTIESTGAKMILTLIKDILTATIAFICLFRMQADLLAITLVIQALTIFFQMRFNKSIIKKTYNIRNTAGQISHKLQEFLSGIMSIIILGGTRLFFKSYIKKEKQYAHEGIALDSLISGSMSTVKILNYFLNILIYGYGGYKVITGTMTIGQLIAFNTYSQMFMYPVMSVFQSNTRIQQAIVSLDRIYKVLDEPIDINHTAKGHFPIKGHKCNISFENVYFKYDSIENEVLKNINLNFDSGRTYALVGYSGSGKSTIVKLIYRLWDVQKGNIKINGIEINKYNLAFLRKNISIVAQDVFLFDDSILNNITLGRKEISINHIEDICKKVDIYDFIMTLPDQFNTIIGEKGIKLSGGQKQRISLARAFLKNTNIVILDEATSALDNVTESHLLSNLRDTLGNKTVIMVAHRLSTIHNVDKIYVFKDGEITESGNHSELIHLDGEYSNLHQIISISN